MNPKTINFLSLTAFSLAVGQTLILALVWFTAFFNPSNSVTIYINRAGEMNLELILIPILITFCLTFCAYEWKKYLNEAKTE